MKKISLVILFSAIITVALSQNPTYMQKLYYSCKVWGFVKYYHSEVSTCQVNWDSVLLSTLPVIKNAVTNNDYNDAIASMLIAAGPMAFATTPSPDTLPPELKRNLNFGWINDPVFRNDIKVILDTIKNNFRPHNICWVTYSGNLLTFPYDDPAIDSNAFTNYPSEFTRLLLLFKHWNIINYFNPYNYVQDIPWDSTLKSIVLSIVADPDYQSFYKTIKRLTARINDAHVEGLTYSDAYSFYGIYRPRLILRYTQNKYIVVKSEYDSISKGDIIESVDGKSTQQWEDSLRPFISAGNPAVYKRSMCSYLLRGDSGSRIQLNIKDSTGYNHARSLFRSYLYDSWFSGCYPNDSLETVKWDKWNCNVGYVNMGKLEAKDVDTMYYILVNSAAIIYDLRNYPNGTAWPIANWMYPQSICFAKLTKPDICFPGTYYWNDVYLGYNGNPFGYTGKVIILCNQETQSQAEYSCMILKAMPNSVIIGSQTAGTDGNVTWLNLSQEIHTGFTTLGVFYPNGDSTERVGIVPDSLVYITPEGVRQGRDEVLEKALQVAGCLVPMLSITPPVLDMAATAGMTGFTVTSNTNWSAVCDASWCTITTSDSGNGTIVAEYAANFTYQSRTAHILVKVVGLLDQTVILKQSKSTIGIEEDLNISYRIYPNPTTGLFYIESPAGDKSFMDVMVQDLHGKIILNTEVKGQKEYWINLSSVPTGIYHIIIKTNNHLLVRKLSIIK